MTDALLGDVHALEETVSESTLHGGKGPVTYTIKVLSAARGSGEDARRTVLFRRTMGGESIELSAETCAQNLLAELPFFLEAALEIQRASSPFPPRRPPGSLPHEAEASRLLRWLTMGETAPTDLPQGGRTGGC